MVPALLSRMENVRKLRDALETGIRKAVPDARLNGHPEKRLPNTLNMTLPGFRGESVVMAMSRFGVYFSSGSACSSGSPDPSPALLAMGLSQADAHCALRFSLGYKNTEEEIARTLNLLKRTISDSKNVIHFVPCR
jgi:cysteine sulfinate desulfinase/cysteine desulfurase-like protein